MSTTEIVVRHLEAIDEVRRVEALQREIWQMPGDREVVPLHLLVTAQKNGGLLLGAFSGEEMAGFLFGFLGRTVVDGRWKHCSHMLGVLLPIAAGVSARRSRRTSAHSSCRRVSI